MTPSQRNCPFPKIPLSYPLLSKRLCPFFKPYFWRTVAAHWKRFQCIFVRMRTSTPWALCAKPGTDCPWWSRSLSTFTHCFVESRVESEVFLRNFKQVVRGVSLHFHLVVLFEVFTVFQSSSLRSVWIGFEAWIEIGLCPIWSGTAVWKKNFSTTINEVISHLAYCIIRPRALCAHNAVLLKQRLFPFILPA